MQIASNIVRDGYANSTKHSGGYAALVAFLWVSVAVEYQDGIHAVIVRIGNKYLKLNIIVLCAVFYVGVSWHGYYKRHGSVL